MKYGITDSMAIPKYAEIKDRIRIDMALDAMNTVIRYANNEDIAYGDWLAVGVADGDTGLSLYDYIDDDTYKDISQVFVDIISDVKDIDDLVY